MALAGRALDIVRLRKAALSTHDGLGGEPWPGTMRFITDGTCTPLLFDEDMRPSLPLRAAVRSQRASYASGREA